MQQTNVIEQIKTDCNANTGIGRDKMKLYEFPLTCFPCLRKSNPKFKKEIDRAEHKAKQRIKKSIRKEEQKNA